MEWHIATYNETASSLRNIFSKIAQMQNTKTNKRVLNSTRQWKKNTVQKYKFVHAKSEILQGVKSQVTKKQSFSLYVKCTVEMSQNHSFMAA